MSDINSQIIDRVLTKCDELRDSPDERYNCGYNNAMKLIKYEVKEFREREADRLFVLANAHSERNLQPADFLAECDKFAKKKYEIYFDELGTMKVVRVSDGFVCWTDRCMKVEIDAAMKVIWSAPE